MIHTGGAGAASIRAGRPPVRVRFNMRMETAPGLLAGRRFSSSFRVFAGAPGLGGCRGAQKKTARAGAVSLSVFNSSGCCCRQASPDGVPHIIDVAPAVTGKIGDLFGAISGV